MTPHGIPLPAFISIALLLLCMMAPSIHCARPSVCVGNIFGGAPECKNCLWITNGVKHCYQQWSKSMCSDAGDEYKWCPDEATTIVTVVTLPPTPATTKAETSPATTQAATPSITTTTPSTTAAPTPKLEGPHHGGPPHSFPEYLLDTLKNAGPAYTTEAPAPSRPTNPPPACMADCGGCQVTTYPASGIIGSLTLCQTDISREDCTTQGQQANKATQWCQITREEPTFAPIPTAQVPVSTTAATPASTTAAPTFEVESPHYSVPPHDFDVIQLVTLKDAGSPSSTTQAAAPSTTAPSTTEVATPTTSPPFVDGLTADERHQCKISNCNHCWLKMFPGQAGAFCYKGVYDDQQVCEGPDSPIVPDALQRSVKKIWCGPRAPVTTATTPPPATPPPAEDTLTSDQRNKCKLSNCKSCWINSSTPPTAPFCWDHYSQSDCETPRSYWHGAELIWCGTRAKNTTTTPSPPPTPRDPRCPSTCTGCQTRWLSSRWGWQINCESWMDEGHCAASAIGAGKDAYWCPAANTQHKANLRRA